MVTTVAKFLLRYFDWQDLTSRFAHSVLNGSNEMTLSGSNSLHQGLDPLPTQLFVAIADRPPVQQITERNRIKQRIIRVEVTLHLLPKMLGSQETGGALPYARFCDVA